MSRFVPPPTEVWVVRKLQTGETAQQGTDAAGLRLDGDINALGLQDAAWRHVYAVGASKGEPGNGKRNLFRRILNRSEVEDTPLWKITGFEERKSTECYWRAAIAPLSKEEALSILTPPARAKWSCKGTKHRRLPEDKECPVCRAFGFRVTE